VHLFQHDRIGNVLRNGSWSAIVRPVPVACKWAARTPTYNLSLDRPDGEDWVEGYESADEMKRGSSLTCGAGRKLGRTNQNHYTQLRLEGASAPR
jgi:hypothetical protein